MTPICTLFSSAKAFEGHNKRSQYNALRNWRALNMPVILLGSDPGTEEAAAVFDCLHIPDVKTTEFGTPLLNDMFEKARSAAATPLIAYINADILLPPAFNDALEMAAERWDAFVMIGQRWDADITDELAFDAGWPERLEALRREKGTLHGPWGLDYFAFPRTLYFTMPPFSIGRPGWDVWLVWTLAEKGVPLVNASGGVPVVHQNHEYRHVPFGDGQSYAGPEAEENLRIYREMAPGLDPVYASTYRATWAFTGSAVVRDTSWGRRWWYMRHRFQRFGQLCKKSIAAALGPQKTGALKRLLQGKRHE